MRLLYLAPRQHTPTLKRDDDDAGLTSQENPGPSAEYHRYCRLLATELTDLERQYLHKRIAEENAALDRLSMQMNEPPTLTNERPLEGAS